MAELSIIIWTVEITTSSACTPWTAEWNYNNRTLAGLSVIIITIIPGAVKNFGIIAQRGEGSVCAAAHLSDKLI